MLKKLSQSEVAQKEIKKLKKSIERIDNPDAKKLGFELINKLNSQANLIDHYHTPLAVKDLSTKRIKENVEELVSIRQQLAKLIKDANS